MSLTPWSWISMPHSIRARASNGWALHPAPACSCADPMIGAWTPVRVHAPIIGSAQEHAGAGCNAQPFDALARIECGIDIHDQGVSDIDHEPIGAGDAG